MYAIHLLKSFSLMFFLPLMQLIRLIMILGLSQSIHQLSILIHSMSELQKLLPFIWPNMKVSAQSGMCFIFAKRSKQNKSFLRESVWRVLFVCLFEWTPSEKYEWASLMVSSFMVNALSILTTHFPRTHRNYSESKVIPTIIKKCLNVQFR